MSIRAITFDAGHTLVEPRELIGDVYAAAAARHGAGNLSRVELEQRFHVALRQAGSAVNTRIDWERIVDQTFAGLLSTPPSTTFFPELFEQFGKAAAWRIYDDVVPTLVALARAGVRLGVISNWDERLRGLLADLELAGHFEVIVVSCEVGFAKPAPEIFAAAARGFALPPAEILHIGDNWDADVQGARAAGFQALRIARGAMGDADSIPSLIELSHRFASAAQ